jgi:hypothetical protein
MSTGLGNSVQHALRSWTTNGDKVAAFGLQTIAPKSAIELMMPFFKDVEGKLAFLSEN